MRVGQLERPERLRGAPDRETLRVPVPDQLADRDLNRISRCNGGRRIEE